jgi:hypothetical protein
MAEERERVRCPWCDSPAKSGWILDQPAWWYRCESGCRFILGNPSKVALQNLKASDPKRWEQVRGALAELCRRESHDFRVDDPVTAAEWWRLNEKMQIERMPLLCRCFDDLHADHPAASCQRPAEADGLCGACAAPQKHAVEWEATRG